MPTVTCFICNKVFAKKSNCKRHVEEVHKQNYQPPPTSGCAEYSGYSSLEEGKGSTLSSRCLERGCDLAFNRVKDLIHHLENVHSKKFKLECHSMENMNEFENWKSSIEKEYSCQYVLKSRHSSTLGEIMYYKCNRNKKTYPTLKNDNEKTRLPKSQGSCKMDNACTSDIKVINENSRIKVEWQKIHYGHIIELQHLRLPKMEKQMIATKLLNGVTPQRILESTRDNIGEHLKRVDLLTSQDIKNIKVSYGLELKDGKRDSNDAFSVALWVQECSQLEENPILFYKEQGKEHPILKKDDFCLIIMNSFQRQMIKTFPSIITIDSTHGLNSYDFEMTTIMVIDEYNHGFPVAEMFTNRKDTIVQNLFFTMIKDKVGVVKCNYFMSDMAEIFFKAWFMVMGAPYPQHLFCSWHVDRAWQSNLNKIKNKEKRAEIYKILKVLQQEIPESNFELAMSNALSDMYGNMATRSFGEYFANTYSHNFRKWAYCFRKGANINTNMHLESMHKVIKYFYLDRKTVKRLDVGLHMVLKYVRDKSVERVIRLNKGENTLKTREISRSHQEALKQSSNYRINSLDHNSWSILKNETVLYKVEQVKDAKCCKQICLFCEACNHMYSCTCTFFTECRNMCKHIHIIVAGKFKKRETTSSLPNKNHSSILETLTFLSQDQQNISNRPQSHNVKEIKTMAGEVINLDFDNIDEANIAKMHHHLTIVKNISKFSNFSDIQSQNFNSTNVSLKRHIEPQIRFQSTKKKHIGNKTGLKRASAEEAAKIKELLQ